MKKNIITVLISFIFLLIGFFIGVIISKWNYLKDIFYEIKLIEIIELLSSIIITLIVGYFITNKINLLSKRNDIIHNLFIKYQESFTEIYNEFNDYIKQPNEYKFNILLSSFKKSSVILNMIINAKKNKICNLDQFEEDINKIKKKFREYKILITDDPMGQYSEKFSSDKINRISIIYQELMFLTFDIMIKLH